MFPALLLAVALGTLGDDGARSTPKTDLETYESIQTKAGKNADAQVRLALWCEAHGLSAERQKHLGLAVSDNPSHALARALLGQVAYQSEWKSPNQLTSELADDRARKARVDEYLARRAKVRDRADELWKLADWCEQNGLKQQAIAHYYQVVERDPRRDAAWKRLGFKKVSGHWDKPERVAAAKTEADLQHKANKTWVALLEKWRGALSSRDKARRADAEIGLSSVTDSRAVPAVWIVFVLGGDELQRIGVKLLGQINAARSSRALAMIALTSQSSIVRGEAVKILKGRDPRDYAAVLIVLFRDPIKYDVKSVNGPGSQGELLVKSKSSNVQRLYTPLAPPSLAMLPSGPIVFDSYGFPVILHDMGISTATTTLGTRDLQTAVAMLESNERGWDARVANLFNRAGLPSALGQRFAASAMPITNLGGPAGYEWRASEQVKHTMEIPIGRMMLDAQISAQAAQEQLAGDVEAIRAYNASIFDANQRVQQVLADATGVNLAPDRTTWEKWLVDLSGYAYSSQEPYVDKPTIVEQVPLSYQPQPTPIVVVDQAVSATLSRRHSCFGAGTLVRTLDGLRGIETLRAGDSVLTADLQTGTLKYQPLLLAYHNPPNSTFRIELDGESIVATGIHRLWKAGKGWTMARDLKPGDKLRTLGGLAVVQSVETERVQPVYNLHVAEGQSFFVGRAGVLAHDNSLVNPTPNPFDSVPDLAHTNHPPGATTAINSDSR
jgi:Pretoxin HINT domain